jgi:hypothetical protein
VILKKFCFPLLLTALFLMLVTGCAGIGPKTVARDRFDYITAISDSWKKQMLLNLVKTRYVDTPVFLEVGSIISQYAVEGSINLGATWSDPLLGDSQIVGGSGKYTDRPTITYTPLTGEKFSRSIMTPIPVSAILSLVQAGYPADFIFPICIQMINGIQNRFGGGTIMASTSNPEFDQLIDSIKRVQESGGLGMRIRPAEGKKMVVLFFRKKLEDQILAKVNTVRQILGLHKDAREFHVVYGSFAHDDREIAILTRSILQIMLEQASHIVVPAKDVDEGRVAFQADEDDVGNPLRIRVRNSASRPTDAHVTVRYRKRWFWIDDRDVNSKRVFSFLMLLFSLTETGGRGGAPIVTIPTN